MTGALLDALGHLTFGALLVLAAVTPTLWRCRRMRRLVPGMSWRTAWALTDRTSDR